MLITQILRIAGRLALMVQESSTARDGGSSPARAQFQTLQGLRGVAAFWVVLFHAKTLGAVPNTHLADAGILTRFVFDYGRGGVAIFFVLSGFVIAHSVADKTIDLRFVGRFALRRSIRLDPPYWASIAFALLFLAYRAAKAGGQFAIGFWDVLAHIFYLQEFVRSKEINVVYWTLTYEVQFYLVYILTGWLIFVSKSKGRYFRWFVGGLILLLIIVAFYGASQAGDWTLKGLFANYWFAFAAGVGAYYGGFRNSARMSILTMILCAIMLVFAPHTREVFNSPAAITAIGLMILGRMNRLSSYLNGRIFHTLGNISYSLYLVHVPALVAGISLGTRIFPSTASGAVGVFLTAIAVTLLLSFLFWWMIERPAHNLARRISGASRNRNLSDETAAIPGADQALR
jgi:peptidoglycan/LPS O-acetylase OafA/YrhL